MNKPVIYPEFAALAEKLMEDWLCPDESDRAHYTRRLAQTLQYAANDLLDDYEHSGWIRHVAA